MKKVIITGASGRLGHASVLGMLNSSYEVIAIMRHPVKIPKGVRVYIVQYDDNDTIERIFRTERPEVVIHLAAITGAKCDVDVEKAYEINVSLTQSLMNLAVRYGVDKFIFASSASVYDQKELSPTDEQHNLNPLSVYGKTKFDAEQKLKLISESSKISVTIFRIFNLYGPGFDMSLINRLTDSSKVNPVKLLGFDNYYRDYIHVDDVVSAMKNYINSNNMPGYSVYNIGSGKAVSNKELIIKLEAKSISPKYEIIGDEISYSWADVTAANRDISFSAKKI